MHSLYEIETVVKRVARYQGLSWGIAEEAGKTVRALEQSALPGLERFDRLINFPYKKCVREINHKEKNQKYLCPIHFGLFFLDQSHKTDNQLTFQFSNILEPLLIIPFLIKAAQKNLISFDFKSNEFKFFIGSGKIISLDTNKIPHQSNDITLEISNQRIKQYSDETWDRLYNMSLETFVEENEEKKLLGAGAGLTDND
jgi:hypothetical protein